MGEQMLLVKFHSNYADEFDVEGFIVMSTSQWQAHNEGVAKVFENKKANAPPPDPSKQWDRRHTDACTVEVYFGTNEQMMYESLEDYMRCFDISSLTDDEVAVLTKLFARGYGEIQNGMLPMIPWEDMLSDEY
jgi:hypothetical protein